jgi:hypothetical protein
VVDHDRLAATGHGIGSNVIIDGRLAGLWKRTLKRDTVVVQLDPLRPLTSQEKDLVTAAVEPYARFLGLNPAIAGIGQKRRARRSDTNTGATRRRACRRCCEDGLEFGQVEGNVNRIKMIKRQRT